MTANTLSIAELLCLTRCELEEMQRHLTLQINVLAPGPIELSDTLTTLTTLANIRPVLARPELRHGRNGTAEPPP